jgi:hypothetical protein
MVYTIEEILKLIKEEGEIQSNTTKRVKKKQSKKIKPKRPNTRITGRKPGRPRKDVKAPRKKYKTMTEEQKIKMRGWQRDFRERRRLRDGKERRQKGHSMCIYEDHKSFGRKRNQCRDCAMMGFPSYYKYCEICMGWYREYHIKSKKHIANSS